MSYINITAKNQDEVWDLLQGIIPDKYLNHWLTPDEMISFKKEIKIKNDKKLTLSEIFNLLSKNGYNIQEINQPIGEKNIATVRISE